MVEIGMHAFDFLFSSLFLLLPSTSDPKKMPVHVHYVICHIGSSANFHRVSAFLTLFLVRYSPTCDLPGRRLRSASQCILQPLRRVRKKNHLRFSGTFFGLVWLEFFWWFELLPSLQQQPAKAICAQRSHLMAKTAFKNCKKYLF